jgi:hypothetical protein
VLYDGIYERERGISAMLLLLLLLLLRALFCLESILCLSACLQHPPHLIDALYEERIAESHHLST